jgi:hypothetical protein
MNGNGCIQLRLRVSFGLEYSFLKIYGRHIIVSTLKVVAKVMQTIALVNEGITEKMWMHKAQAVHEEGCSPVVFTVQI